MDVDTAALETLEVERSEGFATVRLNRPPVNAVNRTMRLELRQVFDSLSEDRTINAVVLAATGSRAFCGGVDLREEPPDPAILSTRALLDPGSEWRAAQHAIAHCAVPVIGAIEAPAIGAGFGLVSVCDIVLASATATFALAEIKVGVLGGASKATRMLGPYGARWMLFTGRPLTADDLYRFGGAAEVTPAGEAEQRARELATELAGYSPLALRLAKESVLRIEHDEVEWQYRTEQDYTTRLRGYEDSAEARRAYLEKRKPQWQWR
jgi:enoyl-CoA hydratase